MMDFDAIIIGAGVVGLAVARELSMAGQSVMVIDKAARAGTETSSRNSEVIHAGIYYPQGSLKARFCVEGKERLTIGERHGVIEGPLIEKPARARGPGQQHPARAAAERFAHGDKLGAPGIM